MSKLCYAQSHIWYLNSCQTNDTNFPKNSEVLKCQKIYSFRYIFAKIYTKNVVLSVHLDVKLKLDISVFSLIVPFFFFL